MNEKARVFESHYKDYCRRIGQCDLAAAAGILSVEPAGRAVAVPFLNRVYHVSGEGIRDAEGKRPGYGMCVILAQYILGCPDSIHSDPRWVAFRDFKKDAAITNVNFFTSDTEQAILKQFQGRPDRLKKACEKLGGQAHDTGASYDLSMAFDLLPRIRVLLLFNDRDEGFPAQCRLLFQGHAEFYLDPESLAMSGAGFTRFLIGADKETEDAVTMVQVARAGTE